MVSFGALDNLSLDGDDDSSFLAAQGVRLRVYNGELDVLCIRLNELRDDVDCSVVVESDTTFSGLPKIVSYDPLEPRIAPFAAKIRQWSSETCQILMTRGNARRGNATLSCGVCRTRVRWISL